MRAKRGLWAGFVLAILAAMGSVNAATQQSLSASARDAEEQPAIVIHSYKDGLSGIRTASPDVKLSVGRDPALGDEPVLFVDYPAPGADPAGRDVTCDALDRDWSPGRAISFRIKPAHAVKVSLSFLDRNRVAYTTWTELKAGVWQTVRISFDEFRPNPYFQPSDAKTGAALDVSDVTGIAFAPHDQTPGRLAISRFVVLK
jgi:hypothetical protein